MELGRLLKGKTVFIDTAPLIFFIEKNPKYSAIVKPVVALIDSGQAKGVTSTITLLEVLVLPLREGNKKLADAYRSILLSSKNLETCEISNAISEKAAVLRAKYGFKTPDSIQLATAIMRRADYFLTNDLALKQVKEIKVVVLEDFI
ncbi:MAG: type II toxin-antitoxin system VapC family toxin [Geobacter sp.]|nr:type II toxin-antitoxin system VapC family toxin [Geobacter sp.]